VGWGHFLRDPGGGRREEAPTIASDRVPSYYGSTVVGSEVRLSSIVPYGTVALHAEVSPDSKPSEKNGHSLKT
jgi:hypothetical protein